MWKVEIVRVYKSSNLLYEHEDKVIFEVKKGERELAAILKSYGYEDSRRGQQYCGSNGDADVVGLPGIHIECKRVEKLNIYDAVEQSKNDARTGEMPVVMHRKNRKEWLVTMPLDDWMELYER